MNKKEKKYFTREYATTKIFWRAEKWFNEKSAQGKLEAIYDAYIINLIRNKEKLE